MNILITGASRGIGRELVEQKIKASPHSKIICVARTKKALDDLKKKYPENIQALEADMSVEADLQKVAQAVQALGSLDLLINNAGVLNKNTKSSDLLQSFQVNAIAPFLLTQSLLPYLNKSKNPQVVQISTLMSSIDDNSSGGYYGYRSSKTALNMLTKSLSIDHPQIRFLLLHPGWVKTEMGGESAPVTVEASASGIWKVIESQTQKESGVFKDYKGHQLKW